jgi:S-adenosylmethionine hydrolase
VGMTKEFKPPIALLSDFGTVDGFIGAVKGVLCALAPGVPILDITHDIPPGDIAAARWTLLNCVAQFPPGTVFWVVVDPGVGTERPPLAVGYSKRWFVAPGNGMLDWVLGKSARTVVLQPVRACSSKAGIGNPAGIVRRALCVGSGAIGAAQAAP